MPRLGTDMTSQIAPARAPIWESLGLPRAHVGGRIDSAESVGGNWAAFPGLAPAAMAEIPDFIGAAEGIRTPDPRITNALLYQLSYRGFVGFLARQARFCHPNCHRPRGDPARR